MSSTRNLVHSVQIGCFQMYYNSQKPLVTLLFKAGKKWGLLFLELMHNYSLKTDTDLKIIQGCVYNLQSLQTS